MEIRQSSLRASFGVDKQPCTKQSKAQQSKAKHGKAPWLSNA
jgi:hypothetical protein